MTRKILILLLAAIYAVALDAAPRKLQSHRMTVPAPDEDTLSWYTLVPERYIPAIDHPDFDSIIAHPSRHITVLPREFYTEPVFDTYHYLDTLTMRPERRDSAFADSYRWIDDLSASLLMYNHARQHYMIANPELVRYNLTWLPEPPKHYRAVVNPITTRIEFEEQKVETKPLTPDIERINWLSRFQASLQFSQAYVSPNWYQGGTKNLNLISSFIYNLKLNQHFYPKYLFDMTVQYKLGLNSAPDDSIRNYNVSEDLFQFNLTAGIKAANRWFYSGNVSFKTQLFNSYPSNSRQMKAAFLSPGELNVGLGMTYNLNNKRKTFSLNLSLSPLSWNMKTCINNRVDETLYGIKPGRNTAHEIGSSLEANLSWKIAYNIVYTSRLFAFTDYDYLQSDWEHTVDFAINRYLSTRLYVHLRYDTSTPRCEDPHWHKFQIKEILSFGFNYTFGSI